MKIYKTGYGIHSRNYKLATPEKLKMVADLALGLAGLIEIAPEFPFKNWVVFAGIAFKFLTKFVAEHQVSQITPEPK
jgi:hypothetical protein